MKLHKVGMFALAATVTMSGMSFFSAPAKADVSYEDLLVENGGDLERSHWASEAIQNLVDKYGVMSGYPDKKFRGQRTLTRFEMAAALYQVMKYIDGQIAETKGMIHEPDLSNFATKDDLKQLAALQMEFKRELDMLKEGQMDLAKRVDMLERVQVHGKVDVRYRDRVAVTDGTDTTSALFAPGNTSAARSVAADGTVSDRANAPVKDYSNNRANAVRDANGLPTKFNSPMEANVTIDDLLPFRVHSQLDVSAMLTDGITLHTGMDMFELGAVANGGAVTNGGHNLDEGSAAGGNFVFRKAMLQFGDVKHDMGMMGMDGMDEKTMMMMHHHMDPMTMDMMSMQHDLGTGASFKVGLMNFSKDLNPNTMLSNYFDNPNWSGHGYGLVGWGGSEVALANQAATGYTNSLSRYWAGGLSASMVDPDSAHYNRQTSPSASFNAAWGWGKFFVGANYGAVNSNRQAAAAGNLAGGGAPVMGTDAAFGAAGVDRALFSGAVLQGLDRKGTLEGNQLALPSQYGDGYGVVGLDLQFLKEVFPIRLGVHAMSYLNDNMLNFSSPSRKEVSGVLDLGWSKNFGLTVGVNKSFIGYDRHSIGLLFNDLGGSGFDIQLGANLATRGLFNVSDLAAGNAGLALGIPFLNMGMGKDNIKLILAARQSLGDNFGSSTDAGAPNQQFKDSGITVSLPYMNVGGTPLNIRAEYSLLLADALWTFRPVAHDVSVVTSYMF
ncbi:MAG: S-layer homology domain-containing protein [Candidatus Sericytochromatia bacterium]